MERKKKENENVVNNTVHNNMFVTTEIQSQPIFPLVQALELGNISGFHLVVLAHLVKVLSGTSTCDALARAYSGEKRWQSRPVARIN